MMIWASWSDFFAMGGYALYVWGSYAVCLVLMLGEPLLARRHRRLSMQEAAHPAAEEQP